MRALPVINVYHYTAFKERKTIVRESFIKGRMDNNIVDLIQDDVFNILLKVYK